MSYIHYWRSSFLKIAKYSQYLYSRDHFYTVRSSFHRTFLWTESAYNVSSLNGLTAVQNKNIENTLVANILLFYIFIVNETVMCIYMDFRLCWYLRKVNESVNMDIILIWVADVKNHLTNIIRNFTWSKEWRRLNAKLNVIKIIPYNWKVMWNWLTGNKWHWQYWESVTHE